VLWLIESIGSATDKIIELNTELIKGLMGMSVCCTAGPVSEVGDDIMRYSVISSPAGCQIKSDVPVDTGHE